MILVKNGHFWSFFLLLFSSETIFQNNGVLEPVLMISQSGKLQTLVRVWGAAG